MTDLLNKYSFTLDFFTQFFATIVGIGTSIITTIITLRIQGKRESQAKKQLQDANIQAATELFRAYIACLLAFHKPEYSTEECNCLLIQCQKMENIEQALTKLNTNDFPQKFLNTLISVQVKIMLLRISLESALRAAYDSCTPLNPDTTEIYGLIKELTEFINDSAIKPED